MAQRNPMNDRYQGDGPQGKTRKSAAKLKPKTEAASSVHIDKKPTTKQERKAASKKRDAQIAAKEAERKRKAEERERQARLEAGEEIEEPKKTGMADKLKKTFIGETRPKTTKSPARSKGPDTPEYHRYKRIYWVLLGTGLVVVASSFLINVLNPTFLEGMGIWISLGIAYPAVIAALIIDYTKVKKMEKAHQLGTDGRKSPKQQKHEQERAKAAALMEESKKAQRSLKRAQSKIPFYRSKDNAEDNDESMAEESSNETKDEQ